jgi:hypothetical protein
MGAQAMALVTRAKATTALLRDANDSQGALVCITHTSWQNPCQWKTPVSFSPAEVPLVMAVKFTSCCTADADRAADREVSREEPLEPETFDVSGSVGLSSQFSL